MNYHEIENFLKKMHPTRVISITLDDTCINKFEININPESPPTVIVEYRKVLVTISGVNSSRMDINPHRVHQDMNFIKNYFKLQGGE